MEKIHVPNGCIQCVVEHGDEHGHHLTLLGHLPDHMFEVEKVCGEPFACDVCFVLSVPYRGARWEQAPVTVLYRVLLGETKRLTQHAWEARKQDFVRSFSQRLEQDSMHLDFMYFSELEQSGMLVRQANQAAQACAWSALVVGAGRITGCEKDPFDVVETLSLR